MRARPPRPRLHLAGFCVEHWHGPNVRNVAFIRCVQSNANVIGETATRAPFPFPLTPRSNELSQAFLGWGGFQVKQPIPSGTPMTLEDHPDYPIMRLAMRRWSRLTRAHNPMEYDPNQKTTSPAKDSSSAKTPNTCKYHYLPF